LLTTFTQNDYEIVNREVLYQGIFRLARYEIRHRLFNGGWSKTFKREVLERYSAAGVLPYDPVLDRVILIEQFRPGSIADPKSPWLIEIPAGILVDDAKPHDVAYSEAFEEAGCKLISLHPIMEYFVSPGGSNEYINLYCGRIDATGINGIHGLKHEHEDIRVINISADEAFDHLYQGHIKTNPAIIALLWLQLHRGRLQDVWID
jgi:ADP-ribose pyrophosphatase